MCILNKTEVVKNCTVSFIKNEYDVWLKLATECLTSVCKAAVVSNPGWSDQDICLRAYHLTFWKCKAGLIVEQ